jgi:hypothetical protein
MGCGGRRSVQWHRDQVVQRDGKRARGERARPEGELARCADPDPDNFIKASFRAENNG